MSGRRHARSDEPLPASDALVLGSCTKAMTATLFALSGDSGLTWDTTVAEAFSHVGDLHVGFRDVTLEELLGGARDVVGGCHELAGLFAGFCSSPIGGKGAAKGGVDGRTNV